MANKFKQNEDEEEREYRVQWWFVFVGALLAIFVIYFVVAYFCFPDMLTRGQFGDMFGGLNALFSGFAFVGVIYTIILQKEELSLQRKELELTRQELKRSASAQEKSEEALSKQAASLKATAKLNGLSAILQHTSSMIEALAIGKYGSNGISAQLKTEADNIKAEIENIIREK